MDRTVSGRSWLAVVIAAGISMFLLSTGSWFSYLFLVPLQVLFQKKGRGAFIIGSLTVFITAGAYVLFPLFYSDPHPVHVFSAGSSLFVLALFAGLIFVNTAVIPKTDTVSRMLITTGIVGILSIPLILLLSSIPEFTIGMKESFIAAWQRIVATASSISPQAEGLSLIDTEKLFTELIDVLLMFYMFFYFALLALNWRIGTLISPGTGVKPRPIMSFRLGERVIWILLIPWTVIFFSFVVNIGMVKYPFWNIGLIVLSLYGLQGLGIANFLIIKYATGQFSRMMVIAGVIFLVLMPGVNGILLVLLPLLGISEVWIAYRKS